jgi:ribokinase
VARIVVLGSLNMDQVVVVPQLPGPGETVVGGSLRTTPGGKGANQAVAAARLGGDVHMVGRVGRDDFGGSLRAALVRDGVDVEALVDDDTEPSGTALIVVDERGENQISVAPGANGRLDGADSDRAVALLHRGDVLLVQLEIPLATVCDAVHRARARGAGTVLNAAPARPLPAELLADLDVLVVNEHEAAQLAGEDAPGQTDPEAAAARLLAMGPGAVVVTLGAAGSLLHTSAGTRRQDAPRIDVVDTTAAGDAVVGALARWLAAGRSLEGGLAYANAAGAHAAARPGAQASLPTADQLTMPMEDPE